MPGDATSEEHRASSPRADSLAEALHAASAYEPLAEQLRLFGQFVGAWDLEWHGLDRTSSPIVVSGELHFGWILDGRAVQDVWRVPVDGADSAGMRAFHGTTIRFYDPRIGAWRSTWIDPLNGRVRRFVGRPVGDSIVLDGLDADPLERWSFRDITPDSFRWIGEQSTDGGRTWTVEDEMYARRRVTTSFVPL
jgi:hypothetical protein